PLLRLLTGQPGRVERPLKPVIVLPVEQNAPAAALRLVVGTGGRSVDEELAWRLASAACLSAGVGAVDLGLVVAPDGAAAVVPMVSGRDVLGCWIRALHQQVRAVNGDHRQARVQARLGLHRWVPKADEEADGDLPAALSTCGTARTMLGAHAADLVVVASGEFRELVVKRVTHFPAASAYRPFTMNGVGGRRCWVALAGYSVCPEPPLSAPSSVGSTAGDPVAPAGGPLLVRDNFGVVVTQGDRSSFHLGDVYGRKEHER
ncbi:MAG: hypothetical protein ACRDRW_18085, partial [Pseudonocardiaceae bacterium]